MIGRRRCVHCRKTFDWKRSDKQIEERKTLPRFCSHTCRLLHGGTGFRPGGSFRINEASRKEKTDRLRISFEKHVIRQEGCWGWKGPIATNGYSIMSCRRQLGSDRGHRASWIIHKGKIPKNKCVCHSCDNRICTNPDHLWLGTYKENNDDKIKKCRENYKKPPHKIGSENGSSKLNEDQVREIKKMLREGKSTYFIGPIFGVSKTTILRIKKGTHWTHVQLS